MRIDILVDLDRLEEDELGIDEEGDDLEEDSEEGSEEVRTVLYKVLN